MHLSAAQEPEPPTASVRACMLIVRRHQVYEILPGESLDPAAVAKWFVSLAPAAIHLANDATEELEFLEYLPNGVRVICTRTCPNLICRSYYFMPHSAAEHGVVLAEEAPCGAMCCFCAFPCMLAKGYAVLMTQAAMSALAASSHEANAGTLRDAAPASHSGDLCLSR